MRCVVVRRWNSKFARFIQCYGVERLAAQLDLNPSAIYHWIRGATAPRVPHAEIIQHLACGRRSRLTMDDIHGHARAVRADNVKLGGLSPDWRTRAETPEAAREAARHYRNVPALMRSRHAARSRKRV
jgi:hypothetical protein